LETMQQRRPPRRPQLIVPSLAIPGASLFSDGLLPPMLGQQRSVQKMNHTLVSSFHRCVSFFCAACLLEQAKNMTFSHLHARLKVRTAGLPKKVHRIPTKTW